MPAEVQWHSVTPVLGDSGGVLWVKRVTLLVKYAIEPVSLAERMRGSALTSWYPRTVGA